MSTSPATPEIVLQTSKRFAQETLESTHANASALDAAIRDSETIKMFVSATVGSTSYFANLQAPIVAAFMETTPTPTPQRATDYGLGLLNKRTKWRNVEYRQSYAEAAVEQGIAWQVRLNREARGLSQKQLAESIGTRQSAISRMEDPEYGKHSLQQLMKVAHAFDCALIVKLASYSTLARESECLSEDELVVLGYEQEISGD